jgi:hypothetical protein
VIDIAGERRPSRAGVADGAGETALARDALQLGVEPGRQLVEPRFRQALADVAPLLGRRALDLPLDVEQRADLVDLFLRNRRSTPLRLADEAAAQGCPAGDLGYTRRAGERQR